MNDQPIVYVVTSGSYSDYKVHLACLDHDTAEAVVKRMEELDPQSWLKEYSVEELPIATSPVAVVLRRKYMVALRTDGTVHVRREEDSGVGMPLADPPVVDPLVGMGPNPGMLLAYSYRGFDVAEKAARDRLAELKAREAGLA